jgi:hypothetical protein
VQLVAYRCRALLALVALLPLSMSGSWPHSLAAE